MAPSPDFMPDQVPSPPGKSTFPTWLLVLGGLGCGCFGLIFLGLITAIALPSFLNQANKAREAEARTYIGSLLRGQQAYFLEKGEFTTDLAALALGVPAETDIYTYSLAPGEDGTSIFVFAEPKDPAGRGFAGAVYAVGPSPEMVTTYTGICQRDQLGPAPAIAPALDPDLNPPDVVCPPGASPVN